MSQPPYQQPPFNYQQHQQMQPQMQQPQAYQQQQQQPQHMMMQQGTGGGMPYQQQQQPMMMPYQQQQQQQPQSYHHPPPSSSTGYGMPPQPTDQQQQHMMMGMGMGGGPPLQQPQQQPYGMMGMGGGPQPTMLPSSSSSSIPQIVWVWQLNDSTFCPFSPPNIQKLEESSKRGVETCQVDVNGRPYTVDLFAMCLIDDHTSSSTGIMHHPHQHGVDEKKKTKEDKKSGKNKRFVFRVDLSSLMTGRPVDMYGANSQILNPIKRGSKKDKKDKKYK